MYVTNYFLCLSFAIFIFIFSNLTSLIFSRSSVVKSHASGWILALRSSINLWFPLFQWPVSTGMVNVDCHDYVDLYDQNDYSNQEQSHNFFTIKFVLTKTHKISLTIFLPLVTLFLACQYYNFNPIFFSPLSTYFCSFYAVFVLIFFF